VSDAQFVTVDYSRDISSDFWVSEYSVRITTVDGKSLINLTNFPPHSSVFLNSGDFQLVANARTSATPDPFGADPRIQYNVVLRVPEAGTTSILLFTALAMLYCTHCRGERGSRCSMRQRDDLGARR
jgi:hypothetical protein